MDFTVNTKYSMGIINLVRLLFLGEFWDFKSFKFLDWCTCHHAVLCLYLLLWLVFVLFIIRANCFFNTHSYMLHNKLSTLQFSYRILFLWFVVRMVCIARFRLLLLPPSPPPLFLFFTLLPHLFLFLFLFLLLLLLFHPNHFFLFFLLHHHPHLLHIHLCFIITPSLLPHIVVVQWRGCGGEWVHHTQPRWRSVFR